MSSPLVHETLQKFRLVISAIRQHSRDLETDYGISGAQVGMLATIAEMPDITVSQVSQSLSVHISTASNLLDKLARAGLVDRLRSNEDRRVVRLRLTDAGKVIVERASKPMTGLVFDALDKLSEETLSRLDTDLASLIQHMNLEDQSVANELMSNLMR